MFLLKNIVGNNKRKFYRKTIEKYNKNCFVGFFLDFFYNKNLAPINNFYILLTDVKLS